MTEQEQQSKTIAGLIGPSLVAIVTAELPFVQPHLYEQQTITGIYLSGVLLFIAGLAVIRVHNRWSWNWTLLVTVTGWVALMLGLLRMFAASAYRQASADPGSLGFVIAELSLISAGSVMTWHAYRPATKR